jgi:hypothetical protein
VSITDPADAAAATVAGQALHAASQISANVRFMIFSIDRD